MLEGSQTGTNIIGTDTCFGKLRTIRNKVDEPNKGIETQNEKASTEGATSSDTRKNIKDKPPIS